MRAFDKDSVDEDTIRQVQALLADPDFTVERILCISSCAAHIAKWVIAANKFYQATH